MGQTLKKLFSFINIIFKVQLLDKEISNVLIQFFSSIYKTEMIRVYDDLWFVLLKFYY